jgi:exodeoxyribonuclease VII small subunit
MPKQKDYQTLSLELDEVLAKLQQPNVQVDEAVKLYDEGLKLIDQLEKQLVQAENTIEQLKLATTRSAEE